MEENITKLEKIEYLKNGHNKLQGLINSLDTKQLTELKVLKDWTIKDVLSHLSAWNWEELKSVDQLLNGERPWWWEIPEEEFNEQEVLKRRNISVEEVIKEWKDSFNQLMEKIETLTDQEWETGRSEKWPRGTPFTVKSMFIYEYYGLDHEGGHAKQIEEFFKNN